MFVGVDEKKRETIQACSPWILYFVSTCGQHRDPWKCSDRKRVSPLRFDRWSNHLQCPLEPDFLVVCGPAPKKTVGVSVAALCTVFHTGESRLYLVLSSSM